MQIYQVGGAVRDRLLGLPSQDNDWVVVGATPELLISQGFIPVGKDFPVFLHPKTRDEYALARTERKISSGYKGFTVHAAPDVTLEEDLRRRDLTINAMAMDGAGNLIDPFQGQADLHAGILRHVSPAFVEDPVRILRVARFAARYPFKIAEETQVLMQEMVQQGEVDALVAERVWQEMFKALSEPQPQRFIEVLRDCGALARIFPEIDNLFGVPQTAHYHPEIDTGIHTLMVVQQARLLTADTAVIFAALTHDLGKATTAPKILPHHYGHEERGVARIKQLCQRYRIPAQHRDLAILVARYHTHCHRIFELNPNTIVKTLQAVDAFRRPQRFAQFLLACEADARGRLGFEQTDYPQAIEFEKMYMAAQQVQIDEVLNSGLQGAAIAEELRLRRITAVRNWRATTFSHAAQ
ncbi:MAG: multifunctional CCA addition/repair protein [Thiotrichaceae bacterium]